MERKRLTGNEKKVLRHLAMGIEGLPTGVDTRQYADACQGLKDKGLALVMFSTGHEVYAADITDAGIVYLENNPHLFNPVNWALISAITGIVAILVTIVLFCIGCTMINK